MRERFVEVDVTETGLTPMDREAQRRQEHRELIKRQAGRGYAVLGIAYPGAHPPIDRGPYLTRSSKLKGEEPAVTPRPTGRPRKAL